MPASYLLQDQKGLSNAKSGAFEDLVQKNKLVQKGRSATKPASKSMIWVNVYLLRVFDCYNIFFTFNQNDTFR